MSRSSRPAFRDPKGRTLPVKLSRKAWRALKADKGRRYGQTLVKSARLPKG